MPNLQGSALNKWSNASIDSRCQQSETALNERFGRDHLRQPHKARRRRLCHQRLRHVPLRAGSLCRVSKTKFTLYFVPTFTYSTKALLVCARCEWEQEVNGPVVQSLISEALPRDAMLAELRRRELEESAPAPRSEPLSDSEKLADGMLMMTLQVAFTDGAVDDAELAALQQGFETITSATKSKSVRKASSHVLTDFDAVFERVSDPRVGADNHARGDRTHGPAIAGD